MYTIQVKRKSCFFDDQSPKFLIVNGKKVGQIAPFINNQFTVEAPQLEVYVKDILNIKSNTLIITKSTNTHLTFRLNTNWLLTMASLLVCTMIILILMTSSFITSKTIVVPVLAIIWLLFFVYTFFFAKKKIYILEQN